MDKVDRNYAKDLAYMTGHIEAMDFIDVAPDYQVVDLIRSFEDEINNDTDISW